MVSVKVKRKCEKRTKKKRAKIMKQVGAELGQAQAQVGLPAEVEVILIYFGFTR